MNAIAEAIRNGGKIEYMGDENPLQDQYLRIVGMQAACRFLATVGEWDLDNLPMPGLSAICGLMADELDSIGGEVDGINAEICRALDQGGRRAVQEVKP
jgi:hypothetical protein